MNDIKPAETEYNSYVFSSKLKARWAVFFDALNVRYKYKPQKFLLSDGRYYVPDFKVKCWGTRGEVWDKPFDLWIVVDGMATARNSERAYEFANFKNNTPQRPVLIVDHIPDLGYPYNVDTERAGLVAPPFNYLTVDGDFFGAFPAVKDGKFILWGDDSSYIGKNIDEVNAAFTVARNMRFKR